MPALVSLKAPPVASQSIDTPPPLVKRRAPTIKAKPKMVDGKLVSASVVASMSTNVAAAAPAVPALAPTPVVEPATAAAAADGAPRRRQLVRGGNAIEAKVLPEYSAAIKAVDDLLTYLNERENDPVPRMPNVLVSATATSTAANTAPATLTPECSAAAPAAPADGAPRRRQLVRGGNAIETKVLPEFTAAVQAIESLLTYLAQFDVAESPVA